MKSLLLSIAFLSFATGSYSQITISTSDLPQSGNTFVVSNGIAFTGMDATMTGANYSWDYSMLTSSSQTIDTIFDESATGTLLSLYFFDNVINGNRSNQAVHGSDISLGTVSVSDVYNFYYNSSASYAQPGFGAVVNGVPLPIAYSPHDIIYNLPMNYSQRDSCDSGYEIDLTTTLGLFYSVERHRSNFTDGWGTLITPLGSFNTLRVKTQITERDSVYIDSLGFGIALPGITTMEYKWFAPGRGIPVLQVNTTGNGIVTGITYQDTLMINALSEPSDVISSAMIFPNPSAHKIYLKYNLSKSGEVATSIYSINGKLIGNVPAEKESAGSQIRAVDIDRYNLPDGNYFVKIATEGAKEIVMKFEVKQ